MDNGTGQAIKELQRRTEKVEADIDLLHRSLSNFKERFNILIGQLQMVKWICGGGVAWIVIKDFSTIISGA